MRAGATTDDALRAGHVETLAREADLVAIKQGLSDDRDLLNKLLGQAQMADAFAKFSVTVTASKLSFVKENKLYQSLKGKESGNGYQFSGTWTNFGGFSECREKRPTWISPISRPSAKKPSTPCPAWASVTASCANTGAFNECNFAWISTRVRCQVTMAKSGVNAAFMNAPSFRSKKTCCAMQKVSAMILPSLKQKRPGFSSPVIVGARAAPL